MNSKLITNSLKRTTDGQYMLLRNGAPAVCPFRAPIPVPGQLGQLHLMQSNCSSSCPLMELEADENTPQGATMILRCAPNYAINGERLFIFNETDPLQTL